MRLYLAGPMTGIADWNFPAFRAAAASLHARGHEVFDPSETENGDTSKPRSYYMRLDIEELLACNAVAVLPGWQASRGASLEVEIARQLELPVLDAATLDPVHETILQEAERIVAGARRQDYGHPRDDYGRTAALWSAILGHEVTAAQAILCMIAVKLSRECNRPKRDNRVDIAGYAACLDAIHE